MPSTWFGCLEVCQFLASFSSFIMKVYIERNNVQVELIRFRKNINFIHVCFCEARNFATDAKFTHGKPFQHMFVPGHTVRIESRYNKCLFDKRQFDSNLLLFTPFLMV